jgi:hypothetical protein
MTVPELLNAADRLVSAMFRRIDLALSDPDQAAACKRLLCSWMTGGLDDFREVAGPVVSQSLSIGALCPKQYPEPLRRRIIQGYRVWDVFLGPGYNQDAIYLAPVFPGKAAPLLDCLVGILREHHRLSALEYHPEISNYSGVPLLSDEVALTVANHIRAKVELRPRTKCLTLEVVNYAIVVRRLDHERRIAAFVSIPLGLPSDVVDIIGEMVWN